MKNQDFNTTIIVPQNKADVFNAITNVRGWWDKAIIGKTDKLNAIFVHHAVNVHTCKLKIIEFEPDKKIVWLVQENYFSFTKNAHEWEGSKIEFEISKTFFKTLVRFTHIGLTPKLECYEHCASEWTDYIQQNLVNLISKTKMPSTTSTKARSTKK